jgi:hypothetical protein
MSPHPTPTAPVQPAPTKRPRGRPRVFDETRKSVLCTLLSIGLSRNEACRQVGVPPSSVAHAARTDPAFAQELRQALIDRANRPPELADIGSRSWRAYARRLEARSAHFRLPSARRQVLTQRRLKRMVRRIVFELLNDPHAISPGALAPGPHGDASDFGPTTDYCSETPRDVCAQAVQKQ